MQRVTIKPTRMLKKGHLQEDVILLLLPESFRVLLSCANLGFCYLNLTQIIKFILDYEFWS